MCLRLCCDPYKLTYIAAIITACEAVVFAALNLILILASTCVWEPPDSLKGGLDKFYSWYFYDNESCVERHEDFEPPGWIDETFPLDPNRPPQTTVEANLNYQISYLVLHVGWFLSALLLIYGNARKLWGFYIPWLLISCTFIIMDVVIAAFFIHDMTEVQSTVPYFGDRFNEIGAMIWIFSMYLRGYIFWFVNVGQTATVLNAFCSARHKRTKQERQRKNLQKKHEKEMAQAVAAASK